MRMLKHYTFLLVFFVSLGQISAQCTFDVPITVMNPVSNNTYCPNDTVTLTTGQFDSYQWYYNVSSNTNTGGTPFQNGNTQTIKVPASQFALAYFYVVGTMNNCSEPSPETKFWDSWTFSSVAIQSSSQSTLCNGETAVVSNAFPGPSIFQWYRDGQAIAGATQSAYEVTTSGTYTLEAAHELCPTYFISSGVGPTFTFMEPTIPTISQTGNVLTASSGSNFQWLYNGAPIQGQNSATINIPALGDYAISVVDANGCEVVSETFTVALLSTAELKALSLEIFPNPVMDFFQIKNEKQQELNIQVLDLQGKIIFQKESYSASALNITTTDWNAGIYFVKIMLEEKSVAYKLVKN